MVVSSGQPSVGNNVGSCLSFARILARDVLLALAFAEDDRIGRPAQPAHALGAERLTHDQVREREAAIDHRMYQGITFLKPLLVNCTKRAGSASPFVK